MGLQERDYARPGYSKPIYKSETEITTFVKKTYHFFAASLMTGAAGAYSTLPIANKVSEYFWPLIILQFALLFGMYFSKKTPVLNIITMFGFVFLTGVTLTPLLTLILAMSGGAGIVGNAFAITSIIVASMSLFAMKSTKDFTSFEKPMFIAILVIIAFSLINIFFLQNSALSVLISGIIALVFSFMVVIDTQNIIKGGYNTPVEGAIALYIDFLNIFISLLQLFGIFNGGDD